jgi:DNA mismatch repair protein MutS
MEQYTPMIRQYLQIKADYPDAFLFFRLGDFYEMFFDDAIKASQELEITLTGRDGGLEERIPMCGVPYHAAQSYIETLVEKGYKVAICEQMEDPKTAKGVVKREVIQLITPGTLVEGKTLLDKRNHYIASIQEHDRHTFAFTYIDLSTGESRAAIIDEGWTAVLDEVSTIEAKEIVVSSDFPREWRNQLKERGVVTVSEENETAPPASFENRLSGLTDESLKICAARLVRYLERTQKRSLDHIRPFEVYQVRQYMAIDYFSKRNLELTETIRTKGKRGSLLWLLDETRTAMGGRLLKQWLDRPLLSRDRIEERLRAVEVLKNHYFEREQLREYLKKVYDIERLAGKVALGTVNARDLVSLKTTLRQIPEIITLLCSIPDEELKERAGRMDPCRDVADEIEAAIVDDPPVSVKEGNMIREGYHAELDRFRDASKNGKNGLPNWKSGKGKNRNQVPEGRI